MDEIFFLLLFLRKLFCSAVVLPQSGFLLFTSLHILCSPINFSFSASLYSGILNGSFFSGSGFLWLNANWRR